MDNKLPQAPQTAPQQRQYDGTQHLKTWTATDKRTGKTEKIVHYPANWKLHDLIKQYPNVNFDSKLVHIDAERDFCVIRVRLFFGPDYSSSDRKTSAHKQGPLSRLDKLETDAKARCAKDLGISLEAILASQRAPELPEELATRLNNLFDRVKGLGLMERPSKTAFLRLLSEVVQIDIPSPQDVMTKDLDTLEAYLGGMEKQ